MTDEAPTSKGGLAPDRGEKRLNLREDDPRARAAARAAFLLDDGRIESFVDQMGDAFGIDRSIIPPDWDYEWKTLTVYNQENPAYQVKLANTGWEPVPAARHPEMMPDGWKGSTITRDGMILMERPLRVTQRVREIEAKKASDQLRVKELQLGHVPDGQFERSNKGQDMITVKRHSEQAILVPNE